MSEIRVLHSCGTWLSLTENWIHTSVTSLPPHVARAVVCGSTANEELYGDVERYVAPPLAGWRKLLTAAAYSASRSRYLGPVGFVTESARKFRANILHSHFGPMGWRDSGPARSAGAKHVITFYGSDSNLRSARSSRWGDRYREMFRHAALVVCEGPALARNLHQLGCPPEKVAVNHLGIRPESIEFQPRSWAPGEPLKVLIAGRFTEKKGIPLALEAIHKVRAHVPVEVTIIGDAGTAAEQQREKARILDTIERHRLADCCTLKGMRPHSEFLASAREHHIFLSPSLSPDSGDTEGGLPVSFLEVAATGMPIVSTRHADIPELLEDRINGCLSDEQDLSGLVDSINWLISNRGHWEQIGIAARHAVEAGFNARTQGQQLAGLYAGLVAGSIR